MKSILIVFPLFFVFPTILVGQESEDCIFDLKKQTDDFIKSIPEFSDYTWNDEAKEALITLASQKNS